MSDHDLLMEIRGKVFAIDDKLEAGAAVMRDHEARIRVQEKADAECVQKVDCKKNHDDLNRRHMYLLITLLVSALGIIGTLIATR